MVSKATGVGTGAVVALLVLCVAAGPASAWTVLEDQPEGPFALRAELLVTEPAKLQVSFLVGGDNGAESTRYYLVQVANGRASIAKVDGQVSSVEGLSRQVAPPVAGRTVELALFRDDWRLTLIWDGKVAASAYDSDFQGAVGYALTGATLRELNVQELGEIDEGDTFEREEGAPDEWEHLSGKWIHLSLREDPQADRMVADYSANAFSYFGAADGVALTSLGLWSWRDCQYSLAFRSRGTDAAVGLAFYLQDKDNYLLLRWDNRLTSAPDGPHLRLMAVVDGKRQTLAERDGGFYPDQWHQLRVNVCDEWVLCSVDGQEMMRATTPLFGHGKIGLYVEGPEGAWFDDVRVTSWMGMVDDFRGDQAWRWRQVQGTWNIGQRAARPTSPDPSLLVTGSTLWSGYRLQAPVTSADSAGLAVCYQSPDDYLLFRWAPATSSGPCAGKAQLVRITPGGQQVLAEAPLPTDIGATVQAVAIVETDHVSGSLDGRQLVAAVVPAPARGAVGLWCQGSEQTRFGSVTVEPVPRRMAARVTKEFTDTAEHPEMADWAATTHAWIRPVPSDAHKVWWSKGDYYGPLEVRLTLQQVGQAAGTLKVGLESDQTDSSAPDPAGASASAVEPALWVTATSGSRTLALQLMLGGQQIAQAQVEAAGDECQLSLERRTGFLVVTADGAAVIVLPWPPASAGFEPH